MTNPTLYTIARSDGDLREYKLTLAEAARRILHDDGADYEIRPRADGDGFELWTRQQVAGIPWRRASYFSFEENIDAAEVDIFHQLVEKSGCDGWRGLVATRQDDYLAMLKRSLPFNTGDDLERLESEIAEINT